MEKIGRYRIVAQIGRGASGIVYRAIDLIIQRPVALKTVPRPSAQSSATEHESYARFLRESRAAGQLSHPNVVTVFDVGVDDELGLSYIAMEFVDGEPLDRLLRRQHALSFAQIRSIGEQVASALDAAHRAGVIHRDIKPANLILMASGTIKVADFGIAKIASQSMTQDGSFLGSPSYMSPEQVRADALDHRTDLFSLGTVMYELATLKSAFGGSNVFDVIRRVAAAAPRAPREISPDLPEELEAIILRAMSRDREQRFESAAEMRDALARIRTPATAPVGVAVSPHRATPGGDADGSEDLGVMDDSESTRDLPKPVEPPRGFGPRRVAYAAAALLVTVIGAVVALRSSGSSGDPLPAVEPAATASPVPLVSIDPITESTPDGSVVATTPNEATPSPTEAPSVTALPRPGPTKPPVRPAATPRAVMTPASTPPVEELSKPPSPFPYHFVAAHMHSLGKKCQGRLRIEQDRLVFDSETDDEDDRDWSYSEIKSAVFDNGELNLVAAERSKLGRDKRFRIKIQGGVIPAEAVAHVQAQISLNP